MVIILSILGLVGGLLVIMGWKTWCLSSQQLVPAPPSRPNIDADRVAIRLTKALQIPTVSFDEQSQINHQPFLDFHQFLVANYPLVHQHMKRTIINQFSLVYSWSGSESTLDPILLLGHMDVVPADTSNTSDWKYDPFGGVRSEGCIWGRGALDDKGSVLAQFEALEMLMQEGFAPRRSVYFAIGHDEEIGGQAGAQMIAETFKAQQLRFFLVLDEGSVVTSDSISDIGCPVALIGVTEKGFANYHLKISGPGGHSAIPPQNNVINQLSEAIAKIGNSPMRGRFEGVSATMFRVLSPHMSLFKRIVFANLWIFKGVVKRTLLKNEITAALLKTTQVVTLIHGGQKENIIPREVCANVNCRIHPYDSLAAVKKHLTAVVNNPDVEIDLIGHYSEPSQVSPIGNEPYLLLQKTILQIFPQSIVAPTVVLGATDSRYYDSLSRSVLRFLPLVLAKNDFKMFHGTDERVAEVAHQQAIMFYYQLILNCTSVASD